MSNNNFLNKVFSDLTPSSTLYINETVHRRWQQGEQVFHMGFGESQFNMHPKLQQALADNIHQKSYLPAKGLPELREKVADYYADKLGQNIKPTQVIIGPGSKALIFGIQMAMDADLFLPTPSWVSYAPQAHLLGRKTAYIPSHIESNYAFDFDAFDELVKVSDNPSKLLILNTPHNPTGQMLSAEMLEKLAYYCRENNILVASDEIYFLVAHGSQKHYSISSFYPEGSFILGGLSKHLSIGGWRLGIAILPDNESGKQLMSALQVIASEIWSAVPAPLQYAAITAYSGDSEVEQYIADCAQIHGMRTRHIYQKLTSLRILCTPPAGAFYMVANFGRWKLALEKIGITTSRELAEYLLEEYSVATLPADAFGVPETQLSLRLSTSYLDMENEDDASRLYDLYRSSIDPENFINETNHPNMAAAIRALEKFTTNLDE